MISVLTSLALSLAAHGAMTQETTEEEVAFPELTALLQQGEVSGSAFEAAVEEVRRAAQDGDVDAMITLGGLIAQDLTVDPNSADAWFERAIAEGDEEQAASGQYNLASYYFTRGILDGRARTLLQGLETGPMSIRPNALGLLGIDYLLGIDGEVRAEEGRALINSAIAMGYENAAVFHAYGAHLFQIDRARAFDMLARAANLGHVEATWLYAVELLNEEGTNPAQAYEMVVWASEQGLTQAKISRAVLLATGQGVEQDIPAAREWYLAAARDGSAHGLRGLAFMILAGEGGEPDPALGYGLIDIAAAAGDAYAQAQIDGSVEGQAERPDAATTRSAAQAWLAEQGLSNTRFR